VPLRPIIDKKGEGDVLFILCWEGRGVSPRSPTSRHVGEKKKPNLDERKGGVRDAPILLKEETYHARVRSAGVKEREKGRIRGGRERGQRKGALLFLS